MRNSLTIYLLFTSILIAGCGRKANPPALPSGPAFIPHSFFRSHFCGTDQLLRDANAIPWVSLGETPPSEALWRQTREKLSTVPHRLVGARSGITNDFAGVFEELISDMLRAESLFEISGESNRITDCVLAVRLPEARAEYWHTNLLTIGEAWTGVRAEALPDATRGWNLLVESRQLRLTRFGDWTVLGWGQGELPLQREYLLRIRQDGRPIQSLTNVWADILLDCRNLPRSGDSRLLLNVVGDKLESARLSAIGRGGDLRVNCDLILREPLALQHEPWQIPTNLIHEPIVGFTGARSVSNMLTSLRNVTIPSVGTLPNQVFVWAGAEYPVQTMMAAPMLDPDEFMRSLAQQFIERFNPMLQSNNAGALSLLTNADGVQSLRWIDIPPWIRPFVSVSSDAGLEFIIAGTYPNWLGSNVPPSLLDYFHSRTNLVFYDWEITSLRVQSWRALINVIRHLFEQPRLAPQTASVNWLNSISNRLGNTITEVTHADSRRLVLKRQGPLGLNGLELVGLAHWLESTNFPLNWVSQPGKPDSNPVK